MLYYSKGVQNELTVIPVPAHAHLELVNVTLLGNRVFADGSSSAEGILY